MDLCVWCSQSVLAGDIEAVLYESESELFIVDVEGVTHLLKEPAVVDAGTVAECSAAAAALLGEEK